MTRRLMELYHEYTERLRNNAVAGSYQQRISNFLFVQMYVKIQLTSKIMLQVSPPDCTACTMKAGLLLRNDNAAQRKQGCLGDVGVLRDMN